LLKLRSPTTLKEIEFDAEAVGLAIWSKRREALEIIADLVSQAKSDPALLSYAIEVAKRDGQLE